MKKFSIDMVRVLGKFDPTDLATHLTSEIKARLEDEKESREAGEKIEKKRKKK